MNFIKVIDKYERLAFSKTDKGTKFERLIQAYLKTDKLFLNRFTKVWLWKEFPYRKEFGGKDIGIDLVAQEITRTHLSFSNENTFPRSNRPPPILGDSV